MSQMFAALKQPALAVSADVESRQPCPVILHGTEFCLQCPADVAHGCAAITADCCAQTRITGMNHVCEAALTKLMSEMCCQFSTCL